MAGEYRWDLYKKMVRRRIRALKKNLGGKCVSCDEPKLRKLEFHHKNGKSWTANKVGPLRRIQTYEREAAEGLICLLCRDCHRDPKKHYDGCFCPSCRGDNEPDF